MNLLDSLKNFKSFTFRHHGTQFPAHRKQPLIEEKGKEPTEKK